MYRKQQWGLARGTLMLVVVLGTACEGGPLPMASDAPTASATVEPGVATDVENGVARDVLVVLREQTPELEDTARALSLGAASDGVRMAARVQRLAGAKRALWLGLAGQDLRQLSSWQHLPILHVRVESPEALAGLAARPEVSGIWADEAIRMLETTPANLALINQPRAAAAGHVGAGTSVAVIDTGVDYTRAAFGACAAPGAASCRVTYAQDFAPDDGVPDQAPFHGTNVAAIVLGVAPAANIIALDVFDDEGSSSSQVLAALDWVLAHKDEYNIVTVNMSLGGGKFTQPCTSDPLAIAISDLRAAGVLSVVSAGNDGYADALAWPGCAASALSVGTVYHANVGPIATARCAENTAPDRVACFSNSASFLTLLAPGVFINAAGVTMTGTSQSSPHVAGALAVLRAAFPGESLDATVTRLTATGVPINDVRNHLSKPRLDVAAALEYGSDAGAGGASGEAGAGEGGAVDAGGAPGPTGTLRINFGGAYTRTATVLLDARATSTATQVCVSNSEACTAWRSYSPLILWRLSSGDGTKSVRVWWKDSLGNQSASPAVASIALDATAPLDGALDASPGAMRVAWNWSGFSDAGSGVARYRLVSSTLGPPPPGCGIGSVVYSGTATSFASRVPRRPVFYRLCAVDKAGNPSRGVVERIGDHAM